MVSAWWAAALAVAAPVVGPEPVLEHAQRDIVHLRRARAATAFAVAAPAVTHISLLSAAQLLGAGREDRAFGAGAFSVGAVGATSMVALPIFVDIQAQQSRKRLAQQGLPVRRQSRPWVTGLVASVPATLLLGQVQQGDDPGPGLAVASYGLYAVAMALPLRQLAHNRAARRDAGWLGGAP